MKRFRPGVIPTVVVALLLPLLVSLGFWQLGRGAEKTALLATYTERRAAAPMASSELLTSADPAYRRVHLQGQFDASHSLLLDNRQRAGKVGVELLQPFQDQRSGLWLLVNRGWLPWPDRRRTAAIQHANRIAEYRRWVRRPGATFSARRPGQPTWPQTSPRRAGHAVETSGATATPMNCVPTPARPVIRPTGRWSHGPGKTPRLRRQWFAMSIALLGLYSISAGTTLRRNTMGTAMNPPSMSEAKAPVSRRRGRIQLLLIVLGVVGPMLLATGMYKLQFWVPEGRSYHGELLGNGQTRADLGVQADEQRWQMLVTRPRTVGGLQQLVYLARQIQIGLGREAGRATMPSPPRSR